jgi:hypothetical protein
MKSIQINFENAVPVSIQDNDESPLDEYSKKISNLLDNTNISLLHTSEGSLVIRPDRVVSIFVKTLEQQEKIIKTTGRTLKKEVKKSGEGVQAPPVQGEDIIKD